MDVNDDKDLCSPCKFEGKQKKATKWCTECDETFCTTCHENHNANMSSKEHHVLLVVGKHMLQSLHIPLTEYCEDHEKEKDLYCSSHKEIICLTCSQTSHGKCEPAVRLREVYKNAKSSSVVSVLENDVIVVTEELKDIIKDREHNKLQLEKQRTEILDTVKDIRKCINAQLDQVENKITEDLTAQFEKYNLHIDKNVRLLTDHLNVIKEIQKKMETLKEYASDSQTFIGASELEKNLCSEQVMVTSFLKKIKSVNIDIKKNEDIFVTCGKIKSFGDIQVTALDTGYCIFNKIKGQYPIGIEPKIMSTFSKALEIKIPQTASIDKCAILPNKQMIFVDTNNKKLILVNEDGTHNRNINMTNSPFDIAVIGNEKIAMSFPLSTRKRIEIISTTNYQSVHEILFKKKCYGISYNNGNLFVIVKSKGIFVMDLCGELMFSLPIEGKGLLNIHVKNDRLYCSDEKIVQCYDMEGSSMWTFKDSNLRSPRSISSNQNFIFIAGYKSNNIVSVSINGKTVKVICDKHNGISDPTSVYFATHHLLMCNGKNSKAFLYKENLQTN